MRHLFAHLLVLLLQPGHHLDLLGGRLGAELRVLAQLLGLLLQLLHVPQEELLLND